MKRRYLSYFCLLAVLGSAAGLLTLQSKFQDTGKAAALPDPRHMIEDLLSQEEPAPQLGWHGDGGVYVLEEDPITRELKVKTNVIPTALPETPKSYALDIKDLYSLDGYLKNLRDQIKVKVFGDVTLPAESTLLDRGYAFYKDLNNIRDRYYIEKTKIDQKAEYLKKVTAFAVEYTKSAKQTDLVNILSEKDVDIDAYNRFILTQLLQRLDEEMTTFHKEITETMASLFQDFDRVTKDKDLPIYMIIERSSQISFQLVSIEQLELDDRTNRMIHIRQLILDNKYYHHISASFDKELATEWAGRALLGSLVVMVLAFFG